MSAATALVAAQVAVAPIVRAAEDEVDPNDVTPGVWGFVITFAIMVVVLLLVLDMTRRIRRTNYRAEVQAELAREMAETGVDGIDPETDAAASDRSEDGARPNGVDPSGDADDAPSGDAPTR
ncbi:hypothetical protein SAMN05428970_1625 [Agromyces sp. CF514]|uniref:hypothetical protein n=1 Tax=Agromyces sp. CF514 TaxID=1881031 RepID=UPI0008EF6855|nr:hypothetical protein [Agromyces sp. CF514]SFR73907.1 hypothetical protein SAMN05428970_1625 [Agromyces sp. CF514]